TRSYGDWSSDVCSSDLLDVGDLVHLFRIGRIRIALDAEQEVRRYQHRLNRQLDALLNVQLVSSRDSHKSHERSRFTLRDRAAIEIGRASCRERGEVAVI